MRIGIVAGESSGDQLGAGLISAIRELHPDTTFEGIAGPRMQELGCHSMFPSEKLSIVGLAEVMGHYRELRRIRTELLQHFLNKPPDIFIGIDVPDFNLGLESRLKKAGIRTVQYVSPQVWAWRRYRVRKIARSVDLLLCLFPFEERFYKEHKVNVQYVGHPLADQLPLTPDAYAARTRLGLPHEVPLIAILPGSRTSEVRQLAATFLETICWCGERRPDIRFVVPLASPVLRDMFEQEQAKYNEKLPVILFDGHSRDVMEASDVVLLASGTATLEALMLKRPMVMAYRIKTISYWLLKMLISVKSYSLPNLLAGEALIPEIIQNDLTPERLGRELLDYLDNEERVEHLQQRFTEIHKQLRQGTNTKAARAVLQLAERAS
jgi:lipid-A-disaccharide synthase